MAQWTDPSRSFLITAIHKRRVIWDKELPSDSHCKATKNAAFQEVVDELNINYPLATPFTGEDVRSQWKNLKDTFVRKLRWVSEGKYSEDPQKEPTWKFYRMLSFLDEKESKRLSGAPDEPNFDIMQLHNVPRDHENGMIIGKQELHHLSPYENGNHTTSAEEQILQLFTQGSSSVSPPSPSLPPVGNSIGCSETICAKQGYLNGDEDEEHRSRKRVYPFPRRQINSQQNVQNNEFDIFGAGVAAQLKRICDQESLSAALRLQKRLNDVLFDGQMEVLER